MTKTTTTETTEEHLCTEQDCSEQGQSCRCSSSSQEEQTEQEQSEEKTALTEMLQRLQAEFENYRKRTEKEAAEFKQYATKQMIIDVLPVLDNFELALKTIQDDGIKLIYAQLFGVLERYGLTIIACDGKWDPRFHEAFLQEDSEKEPGTILEELQKGYKAGDLVIRPARVKISRKKNETSGISTRGNS